jgi:hypothetical protein
MSEDEYYFNRCSVSQYPDIESVRSKSRLSTPIGLNLEPCLSYLPDGNPTPKDIEPEGAFKALQDKGIKITSYDERDGAGRPLKRNRWTWDHHLLEEWRPVNIAWTFMVILRL